MKHHFPLKSVGFSLLSSFVMTGCQEKVPDKLPNILWITSEDNSPFLGCYGDTFAITPNLDKLASEGFLYTHAYANAPVCAPARNTIITGIYACSGGNQHMRSQYKKSDIIRYYPQFLRQLGYYCTNNSKEDYNIDPAQTKGIWDESGKAAHYRDRKPGQPFFAVFNSSISHESCLHSSIPAEQLRHNPAQVKLPPYHPDTPEMRHDWAQYYDKIEDLDTWVGSVLKELEESGEAENTIVLYYGDHGGVLGRSKRFVYESGTRVPFIVRIPEKYKHLFPASGPGEKVDRLISFVDLAPTLLSITGVPVPDWMQGHAFLGRQKTADPQYAFMFRGRMDERYDMSRAVRDGQFRYIRNYMPYRVAGQHINYLWKAPSMPSWERAWKEGKCNEVQSAFWESRPSEELYDTENDPWEVNNLAANPQYRDVLKRMRNAQKEWSKKIEDTGFIPEADLAVRVGDVPFYDYMRSGKVPLDEMIEAAELATSGDQVNPGECISLLKNGDSAVRYWGATGLLISGEKALFAIPDLERALDDPSPNVVVVAAEALYNLGRKDKALDALLQILGSTDEMARCHALNAVDWIGTDSKELQQKVVRMVSEAGAENKGKYDIRMALWLLEKWGINPMN